MSGCRAALRARSLILALLVAGGGAGCGVRPTGVVDAGEPATGLSSGVQVYFVSGGELRPAVLDAAGRTGDPSFALALLFKGPDTPARAVGFRTAIPTRTQFFPPLAADAGGPRVVVISDPPAELPRLALGQIACTAIAALAAGGERVDAVRIATPTTLSRPATARCPVPIRVR